MGGSRWIYGRISGISQQSNHRKVVLKNSTTTLSLQNVFRSIFDHLQLQVVRDEFEFHLKLQCD